MSRSARLPRWWRDSDAVTTQAPGSGRRRRGSSRRRCRGWRTGKPGPDRRPGNGDSSGGGRRGAVPRPPPGRHRDPGTRPHALRSAGCKDKGPQRTDRAAAGLDQSSRTHDAGRRSQAERCRRRRPGSSAGRHRRSTGPTSISPDPHYWFRRLPLRQPLRPGRQAPPGTGPATKIPVRRPGPSKVGRRHLPTGLCERSPGGGTRNPQPGEAGLRQGGGPLVPTGFRQDLVDDKVTGNPKKPLRLQGRHKKPQG